MNATRAIGIDVGGTSVKAVVADARGDVVFEMRRTTHSPDPLGRGVVEVVSALIADIPDAAELPIGVVVPGVVDERRGVAVHSSNLGWRDLPLAEMIRRASGRPVGFGHDVRAGALAEARWGAAVEVRGVVAFVPIGTGMSAAILIDGQPLVAGGWAGEIGQPIITTGPHAGSRIEEIASAAGIARRADAPDARTVVQRVRAGDPVAHRVWDEGIAVLADALTGLTATVGAQTIVIGGGLALAGDTLLVPLRDAVHERLSGLRRPALVTTRLDDRAAAIGATLIAVAPS